MSHEAMGASSPMCDLLAVRCSNIFCALRHSWRARCRNIFAQWGGGGGAQPRSHRWPVTEGTNAQTVQAGGYNWKVVGTEGLLPLIPIRRPYLRPVLGEMGLLPHLRCAG